MLRKGWLALVWVSASCTGVINAGGGGGSAGSAAPGTSAPMSAPPGTSPPPVAGMGNCAGAQASGRVTVRRLNRVEYDNTVRDLFGDTSRPAQAFSMDDVDVAAGFDNNAEVLHVNSQLLSDWMAAAHKVSAAAAQSPRIMTCAPSATLTSADCAKRILGPLARRAWRRAVTTAEVTNLLASVQLAESQGDTFAKGIELAIRRMLLSPSFVFRFEVLADPSNARAQALDGFSIASRLSYFLWRSMPDDVLLDAAEAGKLSDARELEGQVARMLADAKAGALVDDLSRLWLLGGATETASPDPVTFKTFDAALRKGAQTETSLFLGEFVSKNLNLLDMMDADFSFLNERLATHYGISGVTGTSFQKVMLGDNPQRGGLLTQANIHLGTMTDPKFSSLENRGVWVLKHLLCTQLPPPPPNATEAFTALSASLGPSATKRQLTDARDAMPACGACHKTFDPIGFGLENFDVTGAWRTTDRGQPIDASGELPGLGAFNGVKELSAALKKDPRLKSCFAEVFTTFALGRVLDDADKCTVSSIVDQAAVKGYGAADVIEAITQSTAFRYQSGEP